MTSLASGKEIRPPRLENAAESSFQGQPWNVAPVEKVDERQAEDGYEDSADQQLQ
jgi:hypothetical protein